MLTIAASTMVLAVIQFQPWNRWVPSPPPQIMTMTLKQCLRLKRRARPTFDYAVFVSCRKL